MGMSATQMRFLMVTARKSNVEYQGQQINQARTALANQSSELYTELMTLKAPTAPSVYKYVINPTTTPQIDWSADNAYPDHTDMATFFIHYAGNQPQYKDFNIPTYEKTTKDGVEGWHKYLGTNEENVKEYGPFVTELPDDETYSYRTTGQDANHKDVTYTAIHTAKNANYEFDVETGMFTLKGDAEEGSVLPQWLEAYNAAMSQYAKYSKPKTYAIYDKDITGEITADTHKAAYQYSPDKISYNEAQYAAAYAQYEIDLKEYEKACDEINAKTEEIHEADKKLELQLKQLDTEQEAIQTEWEALKKVLDKNIENTFKTFG